MNQPKRYMITSALPYANGGLHLGHLAGAYLPADIFVRTLRLLGKDVAWVCGSDEHGAAITIRAKKEGISPKEIIDKYHNEIKDSFEAFGISFDLYHRTSADIHHANSQEFFKTILEKGEDLEVKETEQYYDEKFNQFLADRYIQGTCPKCENEEAYGDQCEKCGSDLSPTDLINPKSTLSGENPILKKTKHWFLKLQNHEEWLKEWISKGTLDGKEHHDPKTWKNHVLGQCMSWLEGGLHARSITRDLDWGIKVPVEDADGKVLYVWFDAPIGYISATQQWAKDNGKNWEDYWKSPDTELIHFIGKDNIVFHCIIFPAILKAHGGYNLPTNVPANQFLNFEDRKFSTSKGWGINLADFVSEFQNFEGANEALRFVLTRIMPENKDANFKWADFVDVYDNELVNNLGNFVNRVMVLSHKYFEGKTPSATLVRDENFDNLVALTQKCIEAIQSFQFKVATKTLMEISSLGNVFLQESAPWKIFKENPEDPQIANCLVFCAEVVKVISILIEPFLPQTAIKIQQLMNFSTSQNGDLQTLLNNLEAKNALIEEGHTINEAALLFAKINDRKDTTRKEIIDRQVQKLEAILEEEAAQKAAPVKDTVSFEDFSKTDIRTGKIIAAEKVKKANKLLKLTVDLGFETRTIVSGLAEQFTPEEVVGQTVLVVVNLAPRKLRGIESQGMVLMATNGAGKMSFVSADNDFELGQVVF